MFPWKRHKWTEKRAVVFQRKNMIEVSMSKTVSFWPLNLYNCVTFCPFWTDNCLTKFRQNFVQNRHLGIGVQHSISLSICFSASIAFHWNHDISVGQIPHFNVCSLSALCKMKEKCTCKWEDRKRGTGWVQNGKSWSQSSLLVPFLGEVGLRKSFTDLEVSSHQGELSLNKRFSLADFWAKFH